MVDLFFFHMSSLGRLWERSFQVVSELYMILREILRQTLGNFVAIVENSANQNM